MILFWELLNPFSELLIIEVFTLGEDFGLGSDDFCSGSDSSTSESDSSTSESDSSTPGSNAYTLEVSSKLVLGGES
jgi:hypothetical protein